jgi:hypothetical protein
MVWGLDIGVTLTSIFHEEMKYVTYILVPNRAKKSKGGREREDGNRFRG